MRALRSILTVRAAGGAARPIVSSPTGAYGRTAAYRRLSTVISDTRKSPSPHIASAFAAGTAFPPLPSLRSQLQPQDILSRTAVAYTRHFHSASRAHQEAKPNNGVKDRPPQEDPTAQTGTSEKASPGEQTSEEQAKSGNEEHTDEQTKKEKKDDKNDTPPPPPPHGDKTPWQVFTETLQSEFKASKEWNESTKQLSSGINDFTQNETVKRARSAYSSATEAATSTTSAALKKTGKAIGQSAAWTWDTSVVKGVRKGVNAAGRGVEKVTRPVRETEAFKNVKEVIDDGSSSRYGGWVEKEERRKKREAKEAAEMAKTGGRRPNEPMAEDPKLVHPTNLCMMKTDSI